MPFDNIPGVDGTNNFPSVIRAALAASSELIAAFAAKVHTHNASDINAGTLADGRLANRLNSIAKDIGQGAAGDWNLAIQNGWYMGYDSLNAPLPSIWFIGTVDAHNGLYITQTVHCFTGDGPNDTKAYRRSCENGVWSAWYKLMLSQAEQDLRYQLLISAGTTAQYYRGDKTWQTLNATSVGLGNVNNTADAAKPVSTLQAAEDAKLAKGLVYEAIVSSSSGGIADAIVNNIPTFTYKAGRKYRIVWDNSYYQSASGDSFYWNINHCPVGDPAAQLTGLTTIGGRTRGIGSVGTSVTTYNGPVVARFSPSVDTTTQVKFRIQRVVGAGTVVAVAQGTELGCYQIFDDGMQF